MSIGGTMALTTNSDMDISYRTSWKKLGWNWTFRDFWDDLIKDGELTDYPEKNEKPEANTGIYGDAAAEKIATPPATTRH